ncbi:MAG: signal peptidase I [Fibrobacteria bacterium]|nr:signal peptidase I [Fibrobacteria bacterium]
MHFTGFTSQPFFKSGLIFVLVIIASILFRTVFFHAFSVNGNAMSPKIIPGDKILCWRLSKTIQGEKWNPTSSNIVVYRPPLLQQNKSILSIGRIAGWSGDTVDINLTGVFVNGKKLLTTMSPQAYATENTVFLDPREHFSPLSIPSPGDTISFEKLGIRAFEFSFNLLRQQSPEKDFQIKCIMLKDKVPLNPGKIDSILRIPFKKNERLKALNQLHWFELINIKRQLEKKFPGNLINFQREVFENGRKIPFFIVQRKCCFILGDNSHRSHDSRYFGYIDANYLISRPILIYWSKKPKTVLEINFKRLLKII